MWLPVGWSLRRGKCPGTALLGLMLVVCAPVASAQDQSGSIHVRVSVAETEEPIFQAEVRVLVFARGSPSHNGFTDGGGRISFPSVQRGAYYIEASHSDYETVREYVDVPPASAVSVFLRMHPRAARQQPPPGGAISASSLAVPPAARKAYQEGVSRLKKSPNESIARLRKAIEIYPSYAEAYRVLGFAYIREKKPGDAMDALTRAIELEPHSAFAFVLRGGLHLLARDTSRAEQDLLEAVRLEPSAWDAHYELARCYFATGKLSAALEHALRVHESPKAPSSKHLLLVDIYLRQGDMDAALRELEEFAKADPSNPIMPRVKEKITELRRNASE